MSEEKMHTEFKEWLRVHPCNEASAWRAWQAATGSKQREIDELSAQVEVMREALASVYGLVGHATSAEIQDKARIALSITPSAALLAHDNEVAAKALEEAAELIDMPIDKAMLRAMAKERRKQ